MHKRKKFNNEADVLEWIFTTYGIIKAFEARGWALYSVGHGPMMFTSVDMIMEIVQFGRTEDVMDIGMRYILLPLLKDSEDVFQMRRATDEVFRQMRGPYFIDLQTKGTGTEKITTVVGRHLIDTVAIKPPFLNIVTDVRFGYRTTENVIEIHLSRAAEVVNKQVMMSLRGAKVHATI